MNSRELLFCQIIKAVIHQDEPLHLSEKADWAYLTRTAKEHNLLPIFMEGAVKHSSYVKRGEYMVELGEAFSSVDSQVKRTQAFLRLYDSFIQADIYPLVMKGLICRELYGKLSDHRTSVDEDILIRPEEYWKAKDVLLANGYEPQLKADTEERLEELQEVSFINTQKKMHIELHLNIIGKEDNIRIQMNNCFKDVFDNYRELEIQGVKVRTMGHYDHMLFLILHAFKHFMGSGLGVRQILDILLYHEKYGDEIDFLKMHKTLQDQKVIDFWSDIIHIGNLYLGFNLQTQKKPICPKDLLENLFGSGTFGGRNEAEKVAVNVVRNIREESSKSKYNNPMTFIWKTIFPSKEYMSLYAPYLNKNSWLLPFAWISRWGRFIKRNKKHNGNLAMDSVMNSQRRIKVLKKYDLI